MTAMAYNTEIFDAVICSIAIKVMDFNSPIIFKANRAVFPIFFQGFFSIFFIGFAGVFALVGTVSKCFAEMFPLKFFTAVLANIFNNFRFAKSEVAFLRAVFSSVSSYFKLFSAIFAFFQDLRKLMAHRAFNRTKTPFFSVRLKNRFAEFTSFMHRQYCVGVHTLREYTIKEKEKSYA